MNDSWEYRPREDLRDPAREFRLGEGRISAYASVSLGALSLLGVLAYLFPSWLTTTELRAAYDAEALQVLLKYGMWFSLFFGGLTFVLGRYRRGGATGIALTLVAFGLGGYTVPVGPVEPAPLSLGVDWLILALLGSVAIFMTLEKLLPRYRNQPILRPEWSLDLAYFCFNHLAITAIVIYGNYHASHFDWAVSPELQAAVRSMPVPLQALLILLAADFVLYWEHRLFHEVRALWPIHAVHHSVEHLDWLAGSRGHFVQVFSERAMVLVPLYLLGASEAALNLYVVVAALQAVFIHCNTSLSLGVLDRWLVTPRFHHWHHSTDGPAIDTNYAAHTTLFDRLFGTYHMPEEHWPLDYGTTKRLPRSWVGQLLYPITAFTRSAD